MTSLYIKLEEYNISILNNVLLAFLSYKAFFLGCQHTSTVHEIFVAYNLSLDKSSLKV